MVRRLIFFIIFCISANSFAQHEPQFSQNMFNHLTTNPGAAGHTEMFNLVALSRQQYMGFEGAPKTTVFDADVALKILGHEDGVGLHFMTDQIGAFTTNYISFNYAYRVIFDKYNTLGLGLSLGIVNQNLIGTDLYTEPKNYTSSYHKPNDRLIPQSEVNGSALDMGLGIYFKSKDYYAGLSVTHLNKPTPNFKEDNFFFYLNPTWYLTGGYTYKIKDKPIELKPSLFVKTDMVSVQFDTNVNILFKKRYWGGLTYRLQDAIVVLAGIELKNGLRFGYTYDITTSAIATGSHELMVGYNFEMSLEKRTKRYKSVRNL